MSWFKKKSTVVQVSLILVPGEEVVFFSINKSGPRGWHRAYYVRDDALANISFWLSSFNGVIFNTVLE